MCLMRSRQTQSSTPITSCLASSAVANSGSLCRISSSSALVFQTRMNAGIAERSELCRIWRLPCSIMMSTVESCHSRLCACVYRSLFKKLETTRPCTCNVLWKCCAVWASKRTEIRALVRLVAIGLLFAHWSSWNTAAAPLMLFNDFYRASAYCCWRAILI